MQNILVLVSLTNIAYVLIVGESGGAREKQLGQCFKTRREGVAKILRH
jgi:hypothetical protein